VLPDYRSLGQAERDCRPMCRLIEEMAPVICPGAGGHAQGQRTVSLGLAWAGRDGARPILAVLIEQADWRAVMPPKGGGRWAQHGSGRG